MPVTKAKMRTSKRMGLLCCVLLLLTISLVAVLLALIYERWLNRDTATYSCLSNACIQVASRVLRLMNSSADPCHDFYEFACGGYARRAVPWNSAIGVRVYGDLVDTVQTDLYSLLKMDDARPLATFMNVCKMKMDLQTPQATALRVTEKAAGIPTISLLSRKDVEIARFVPERLVDVGQPLLLNFAVRSAYKGINCLAEPQDAEEATEESPPNVLCIDTVFPVLHLHFDDVSISRENFINSLQHLYSFMLNMDGAGVARFHTMIERLGNLHQQVSKAFRKHIIVDYGSIPAAISYQETDINSLPRFYQRLLTRAATLTNTSTTRVFIRNLDLLKDVGAVLDTADSTLVANYAMLEASVRLRLLLGDNVHPLRNDTMEKQLHILDKQVQALFGLTTISTDAGRISLSRRCLQLTYMTHRAQFKNLFDAVFPDNEPNEVVGLEVKQVLQEKIQHVNWMDNDTRVLLNAVVEAMPLEMGFAGVINNTPRYGSSFVANVEAALRLSVQQNLRAWTPLGSLAEHTHTFTRFRQFFRDGLLWRHLSGPSHPDYMQYGLLGYLTAYEMADVLETHPLSVFSIFDRLFSLNRDSYIIYKIHRSNLLKVYKRSLGPGQTDYRVEDYQKDSVANSIAVSVAYEAFRRTQFTQILDANSSKELAPSVVTNSERAWRLPNLNSYSDEKKFFLTMTQLWCERQTRKQHERIYQQALMRLFAANEGVAAVSGWSGTGLSQTQPGYLTTAAMMRTTNIFSQAYGCSLVGRYEKYGIFVR